jgi:3-hydroxyacyl-CoA dehydrogenase/enoyl-CoA hydratase/3-hydroxybutyryl-CoA epimerase
MQEYNAVPGLDGLQDWRFEVDREQIAWAIFDREGESANSLGQRPLEELGRIIEHVEAKQGELAGLIIISGKSKGFIVGADIREFDQLDTEAKVKEAVAAVNAMLDRLEAFKIPTVCAIHGNCLGGGLELALACSYRIATRADETRIAFPEVKLGIFPGFNGTARSIRQAGAVAAMQAMLTGRMIRASAARAMGLIDELVPNPERLRWAARKAVVQKRRSKPEPMTKRVMRQWPARGVIAKKMRTETAKKAREDHYPAPFRLIDLFETHGGDLNAMKRAETEAFAPLMVSDTARNLRRVFALSEEMKALAPKGLDWKPLRVHVIGAGVMGADIAGWCVASGMQASLQDLSAEQIEKGIKAQAKLFKRKFRTPAARAAAEARLIADPDGEHVARADVVIEAVVEKLEVKRQIFKDLENKMKPGAVMATNTSSIMIEDIAEGLDDPGRLIGIHFFNPAAKMPLVEIIRGKESAQSEIDKGCRFVTEISKFPLVVKSVPGFLVNRVLAPYMFEAFKRLEAGTPKEKLDEAAVAFGMPMGPIELADTVGLDVCQHVGDILTGATEGSQLAANVKDGRLGKKSGQGFYVWKDGKPERGETKFEKSELEALGRELVAPLVDEAGRCRDEGVVASADLIDAGVIFGTGFAPFRGGPLHYRESRKQHDTGAAPRAAAE